MHVFEQAQVNYSIWCSIYDVTADILERPKLKQCLSLIRVLIRGIKWRQLIKLIPQPYAISQGEPNEAFDRTIRGGYCSITVANHRLITVVKFIVKSYIHPWKFFVNRLYLVLHAEARRAALGSLEWEPNRAVIVFNACLPDAVHVYFHCVKKEDLN